MLKDRILLLDKEIKKLTDHCGRLYKELAIVSSGMPDRTEYDAAIIRLSQMRTEKHVIEQMIRDGHP